MANIILQKTIENGEKLATVDEKLDNVSCVVDKHDNITFPLIQNTLIRMESKQNKDIALFVKKEEALRADNKALEGRVKGVEDYIKLKQAGRSAFFGKIYETVWVWMQKFGFMVMIAILIAILGFEKAKQILNLIN